MRRLEPIWPFCGLNRITHAACSTPLVRFCGACQSVDGLCLKTVGRQGSRPTPTAARTKLIGNHDGKRSPS